MTKKSGLGRGLGSLIPTKQPSANFQNKEDEPKDSPLTGGARGGEKEQEFKLPKELKKESKGQLIIEIPVSQIVANPEQPRHYFNEDALENLMSSIKEHGILQPLVVCEVDDDKFELIAGERRFRASSKLGLATVPAIVRNVNQQEKLELAIIENVQRENLNPVEEAKSYFRLNNEFNLTQEEVAQKVGKSRSQVANMIRLLDLPIRIQDALVAGDITVGHAKTIASLPDETDQIELFKSIVRKNLNVRETERASNKLKFKSSKIKHQPLKDANLIEKEELLRDVLSTKVNITNRGQRGKIEIEFYSNEELNNIIERIVKC